MKIRLENVRKLKLSNNKGYTVAVTIALIFVFTLLMGYYLLLRIPSEKYTTIYLLDYQHKKAINYPEVLVINKNNTFNVWIGVENHIVYRSGRLPPRIGRKRKERRPA